MHKTLHPKDNRQTMYVKKRKRIRHCVNASIQGLKEYIKMGEKTKPILAASNSPDNIMADGIKRSRKQI